MNRGCWRVPIAVAVGVAVGCLSACGNDDDAVVAQSLPPIRTTTTTTVPTSTTDPRFKLYELKPGENLAMVAEAFAVPLEQLIELNQNKFNDPNNVPVGVVLEIPQIVIIDELPSTTTTAP